jgi:NADH-quinone oxidoreductase subunit G
MAGATDRCATMQDVFDAASIVLVGNDPTQQHPLLAYQIRQAVRQHAARLRVVNRSAIKLAQKQAKLFVPVRPGSEGELVRALAANAMPPVDLFPNGPAGVDLAKTLAEELRHEPDTVVIFGDEIQGETVADLVRWGLTLPGRTRFVALGDYANSRGAADMGVLPGTLPGYGAVSDGSARQHYESAWSATIPPQPGRNIRDIVAGVNSGEIKALLVFGSNPVKTFKLDKSLSGKLGFLMVEELFPTETTVLADVVLPATSFAEKSGTITNTCGEIQALKKTMRKAGTCSDLEILLALALEWRQPFSYRSADDVLNEIIATVPGYAIALPSLLVGKAIATKPKGMPPKLERPDLVFSSRDSLFTSGTVSQFSWALNSVDESRKPHGHTF